VALLAGCASLSPDSNAAGDVARTFFTAVSDGDGDQACALLLDSTREELEQSSGSPCASSVLEEDLPSVGDVLQVKAYGRNAQVLLDGDVVFLAVVDGTWKVTAAGCLPRPAEPYDCSVQEG
jgi:hypothetical protein